MKSFILFIALYICITYTTKLTNLSTSKGFFKKAGKTLSNAGKTVTNTATSTTNQATSTVSNTANTATNTIANTATNVASTVSNVVTSAAVSFVNILPGDFNKLKSGNKKADMSAYPAADLFNEATDPNTNVGNVAAVALPVTLPSTYNWATNDNRKGFPVISGDPKYQGICGSCWAQASTAIFEAYLCMNFPNSGQCRPLAANYATSCSSSKVNDGPPAVSDATVDGCAGSNAVMALHYLRIGNAAKSQASFYANGVANGFSTLDNGVENLVISGQAKCSVARDNSRFGDVVLPKMSIFKAPSSSTTNKVKEYIWAHGPAMTKIDASQLQNYAGETISDPAKCSGEAEHSVVIVGWKTDAAGNQVWIIRNSWGTSWGSAGYFFVKVDNCGVAANAIFLANANIAPSDRNALNPSNNDPAWFVTVGSTRYAR